MLEQAALKIELHRHGKVQALEIQTERALVGSGSHCDLRLHPEEAAVEQLVFEIRDDSVHAEALAFEPPCLLNGAPFFGGKITADGLLEVGNGTALRVDVVAATGAKHRPKSGSQSHPAVQTLGLVLVACGLYFVLREPHAAQTAIQQAVTPPPLPKYAVACPQNEPMLASAAAMQALGDAESKRERSPFVASDGLRAIELYARAAACFRVADDEAAASSAAQAGEKLRERLGDELHVRHVRIERLLAQEKYASIPLEVRNVQELVPDRTHVYASWLSRVEREAQLRNSIKVKR